jgi:uncharacterized protein (UPF0332 family)
MASRLIDAADVLLNEGRRSTAFRRRAVSTAYYAVFHALAKLCADYVTQSAQRSTDVYSRAYRALDHGPLRHAFAQPPLTSDKTLSRIGAIIVRLQAERHRADYLPPVAGVFSADDAQEVVDLGRRTVDEIESLDSDDRRTLAIALLFKTRTQ